MSTTITHPPAAHCAQCGKSLAQCGGRRVVGGANWRLSVSDDIRTPSHRSSSERAVGHGKYLVLTKLDVSDALFARLRAQAQAGHHPWFCQACSGRLCECGAPSALIPGALRLSDDGTTQWHAIQPIGRGWCERHQPGIMA